jgi:hypothetical protein
MQTSLIFDKWLNLWSKLPSLNFPHALPPSNSSTKPLSTGPFPLLSLNSTSYSVMTPVHSIALQILYDKLARIVTDMNREVNRIRGRYCNAEEEKKCFCVYSLIMFASTVTFILYELKVRSLFT